MKIKITENQYSKIRLVLEQEEYMTRFKDFCNEKLQEVNKIYSNLISLSIGEILQGNINLEKVKNGLDKIENDVVNARKNMESMWNQNIIGTDNEDFDMVIWGISDVVTDRIDVLGLVLFSLIEAQEKSNTLVELFKDVKPIEIQSF